MAPSTFLGRLRRDKRGNTIAIMAASLVPLMGFAGSAVDFARIYVVKVRLQQACDAGVLAGRKALSDTSLSTALDSTAASQANSFFANNFFATYDPVSKTFTGNWYKTTNIAFTPTKVSSDPNATVANTVSATASTTLPMVVMNFFGITSRDLVTTCQARFDLADTDVMFVLDNTGSMSCYPSDPDNCAVTPAQPYTRSDQSTGYADPEKPQTTDSNGNAMYSKIESLRQAVMLFDSTFRANADSTTHFRYGFVTYTSAVNVGAAIPSQYLQNTNWTYQSRHLSPTVDTTSNTAGDYDYGGISSIALTNVPQAYCVKQRYPSTGFARTGPTWNDAGYYQAAEYYNLTWSSANNGTCSGTSQPLRPFWRYEPTPLDVSGYANSIGNGNAVATPGRLDGLTSKWRGCIEEVNTSTASSFDVSNLPDDLNPDFMPSLASDKWRPMWQDAVWLRGNLSSTEIKDESVNEVTSANANSPHIYEDYTYRQGSTLDQGGSASCGAAARRLTTWTSQQVHDYVYGTDFKPFGGTYHDTGMIWGTRMLSPNGVFAADTQAWPGRNDPSRNIVFMTDGVMSPSLTSYGQYGVEYWDQRVTGGDYNNQYNRHVARFRIECDAAKARGINIYVVAVGTSANADLTYCASPGQVFTASSTAALTSAFKTIAQRVAALRITG